LVQGGKKNGILALHLAGGVLGGSMVGFFLGLVGMLFANAVHPVPVAVEATILGAALAIGGVSDAGLLRLRKVTPRRQTPGSWPCSFGNYPAGFAWGFDLGALVTTRIPYQATLVLPIASVVSGSVPFAVGAMGAYGLARALAVALAVIGAGEADIGEACSVLGRRAQTLSRVVGWIAVSVSATAFASAWG
jgi:hypothetical protein